MTDFRGAQMAFAEADARLAAMRADRDNWKSRAEKAEADLAKMRSMLRRFAEAGDVAHFYVEEVCPPLEWPIFGARLDPDGPPQVTLTTSDFLEARALLKETTA